MAALPEPMRQVLEEYEGALAAADLSDNTRRVYRSRVSHFLAWLAEQPDAPAALTDPHRRNRAVQDYQAQLREQGRPASAVNAIRVAIDDLYRHLGLGGAVAGRDPVTSAPAAAIDAVALAAVDDALGGGGPDEAARRRAVVQLMRYAGLNGAEVAALRIADTVAGDNPGVQVSGPRARTVPLHPELAAALRAWRKIRDREGAAPEAPLFPNRGGAPLSARSITGIVQEVGEQAGVALSPAALHATFVAALRDTGADPATVAALTGRRPSDLPAPATPSAAALRAAVRRSAPSRARG